MPNWKSSKNKKDKAKRDVNRRPFLQGPKRLLAALDWSFRTIATLIPEIQLSSEELRIYTSAFTQIVLSNGRVQMDPSDLDSKICGMFIFNVSEKFNFFFFLKEILIQKSFENYQNHWQIQWTNYSLYGLQLTLGKKIWLNLFFDYQLSKPIINTIQIHAYHYLYFSWGAFQIPKGLISSSQHDANISDICTLHK